MGTNGTSGARPAGELRVWTQAGERNLDHRSIGAILYRHAVQRFAGEARRLEALLEPTPVSEGYLEEGQRFLRMAGSPDHITDIDVTLTRFARIDGARHITTSNVIDAARRLMKLGMRPSSPDRFERIAADMASAARMARADHADIDRPGPETDPEPFCEMTGPMGRLDVTA